MTKMSSISSSSASNKTESTIVCSDVGTDLGDQYFFNTPTPSYLSNRSSLESFDSNDLPSMHSEVISEFSTVLSSLATESCVYSSVSTHRQPDVISTKTDNVDSDSEENDLVNFAVFCGGDDQLTTISSFSPQPQLHGTHHRSMLNTTFTKDRALSPISISTISNPVCSTCDEERVYTSVNPKRDELNVTYRKQLLLRNSNEYMSSSNITKKYHNTSIDKPVLDDLNIDDDGEYSYHNETVKDCTESTVDLVNESTESPCSNKPGLTERKRRKESFRPMKNKSLHSSNDDLSVHSFKIRRLKHVVNHLRVPDIEEQSPPTNSDPLSEIVSLEDSEKSNTDNSSAFVSSGDSSRDDAIISLSIARAYAVSKSTQSLPLHCPTPMTNISHSPSPLSSLDNSRFDTSEENSSKDDELIEELNTLAFAKRKDNLPESRSSSLATHSTCLSAKPTKKVRFNNIPTYISHSQFSKLKLSPIIRHTRSSQLREQCNKRKKQLFDKQRVNLKGNQINTNNYSSSGSSIVSSLPAKCARK